MELLENIRINSFVSIPIQLQTTDPFFHLKPDLEIFLFLPFQYNGKTLVQKIVFLNLENVSVFGYFERPKS